jgi:hypothetical protein
MGVVTHPERDPYVTRHHSKVIRNVLDQVLKAAPEFGASIECLQKVSDAEANMPRLQFTTDNATFLTEIGKSCQVGGGTAWLWARADAFESVDTLFIDEAAQMSLANVLAVSQAAKSIVLLGDPQQLEQPMQGSHPEGTDVSALTHILGPHATIPADRGLFLDETWRLPPEICAFTLELFYEDRLQSRPGLELQQIRSNSRISGSGLRFLPLLHEGNQNSSPEEADAIRDLVAEILNLKAMFFDPYTTSLGGCASDVKGPRYFDLYQWEGGRAYSFDASPELARSRRRLSRDRLRTFWFRRGDLQPLSNFLTCDDHQPGTEIKSDSFASVSAVSNLSGVGSGRARDAPGAKVQPPSSKTILRRRIVFPRARASASPRPTDQ